MKSAIRITALMLSIPIAALGQNASLRPLDLTDKAYTVISAFLRVQLAVKNSWGDIRVGTPGSVIAPETMPWKEAISPQYKRWMKHNMKGLRNDTIADFQRCAASSVPFGHRLSLPVEYQIATQEEAGSVEKLYANHPVHDTFGLLQFSCVGWDTSETQALFLFERTKCHCGVSQFVLMEKNTAGEWETKAVMMRWID